MKKLEIMQELPKRNTETWSQQMLLENGAQRFTGTRMQQTGNLWPKKKKKKQYP